ncbi:glutathione S-transferase family protein [Altererythrobacter sp.]|nr:glutathione S-transferase family protein [Altererythrobacter sp.]
MAEVRIFGPVVSTYVRIVEIVSHEAGLTYEVVPTPAHSEQNRHPFGKVPVVEVDGLELYETLPIARYLDNRHNGGALQPSDPVRQAVMDRWIAVADTYLFPLFEHGLVMPWIMHRYAGQPLDEDRIAQNLSDIAKLLEFLDLEMAKDGAWTGGGGSGFTLADIWLYVILRGVQLTPHGAAGLSQCDQLSAWMAVTAMHPSIQATKWDSEPIE